VPTNETSDGFEFTAGVADRDFMKYPEALVSIRVVSTETVLE